MHVYNCQFTQSIIAFIHFNSVCFQVKLMFTPRRVTIIIASGFIFFTLWITPFYFSNLYMPVFFPDRNKTLLAIKRTKDYKLIEQGLFTANMFIQLGIYACVICCTALITSKLKSKTKWRQAVAAGGSENVSGRDQKVSQMVVIIAIVFVIACIPNYAICIGMTLEKELGIEGRYKNTLVVMFGWCVIFESINSATNIWIYYKMSSKYRLTFQQLFGYQPDSQ